MDEPWQTASDPLVVIDGVGGAEIELTVTAEDTVAQLPLPAVTEYEPGEVTVID
jgi:hypothetical protein